MEQQLAKIEAIEGEGLMLREPGSKYDIGRSSTLLKVKRFHDAEAVVLAHQPGKGKHKGRAGALKVKLPGSDAVTHVGTGMNDKLRDQIAKDPKRYIGRAVKVKTQQVFPSGKMRAPSFGGWHLEKGKEWTDS